MFERFEAMVSALIENTFSFIAAFVEYDYDAELVYNKVPVSAEDAILAAQPVSHTPRIG